MARQSEISSTERLLNLIRRKSDDKDAVSDSSGGGEPLSPRTAKEPRVKKKFGSRQTYTLGVDFGGNSVRVAGIKQTADKKPVLNHYVSIPYPKDVSLDSPQFPAFLKSIFNDLIGARQKVDIWCTIPATHVETRFLKIPKVPKSSLPTRCSGRTKRKAV